MSGKWRQRTVRVAVADEDGERMSSLSSTRVKLRTAVEEGDIRIRVCLTERVTLAVIREARPGYWMADMGTGLFPVGHMPKEGPLQPGDVLTLEPMDLA